MLDFPTGEFIFSPVEVTTTKQSLIFVCAALMAATLPCGCSREEPLPDGPALKAYAENARDEARTASEARDPKAARRAADRAKAAKEKAEKQEAGAAEADRAAAQELAMQVTAVARVAARFAEVAEEEQSLAEKTGSLKLKAYRAARGPALKIVFSGLALAAERAASADDSLSEPEKNRADLAKSLAELVAEDLKRHDGKPDWPAIAARMKAVGDNPSPKVGLLLAVAYVLLACDDLALAEADLLKPDPRQEGRSRAALHRQAVPERTGRTLHLAGRQDVEARQACDGVCGVVQGLWRRGSEVHTGDVNFAGRPPVAELAACRGA